MAYQSSIWGWLVSWFLLLRGRETWNRNHVIIYQIIRLWFWTSGIWYLLSFVPCTSVLNFNFSPSTLQWREKKTPKGKGGMFRGETHLHPKLCAKHILMWRFLWRFFKHFVCYCMSLVGTQLLTLTSIRESAYILTKGESYNAIKCFSKSLHFKLNIFLSSPLLCTFSVSKLRWSSPTSSQAG